jgi:hypothetical protein
MKNLDGNINLSTPLCLGKSIEHFDMCETVLPKTIPEQTQALEKAVAGPVKGLDMECMVRSKSRQLFVWLIKMIADEFYDEIEYVTGNCSDLPAV